MECLIGNALFDLLFGLRKCIYYWPEDGRAYVALGKALSKQSKTAEARAVYEKGCQATQGENPYIWQVGFLCFSEVNSLQFVIHLGKMETYKSGTSLIMTNGY